VNLFVQAAEALRARIEGTGAEEGAIEIVRNHDALVCPYERGVPLEAAYGGRVVQFVTGAPVEARVKISMLFGAPLAGERERSAAGAVINAVAGFFGFARNLRGCAIEDRPPCLRQLSAKTAGRSVRLVGMSPLLEHAFADRIAAATGSAEVMIVLGHGLVTDAGLDEVECAVPGTEILMVGPSISGTAALLDLPHWCPYGR
jgi:hypothetical protein